MRKFKGTCNIVETPSGHRIEFTVTLFNEIYAYTGKRSKKARHKRKQVKKLVLEALSRLTEITTHEENQEEV